MMIEYQSTKQFDTHVEKEYVLGCKNINTASSTAEMQPKL